MTFRQPRDGRPAGAGRAVAVAVTLAMGLATSGVATDAFAAASGDAGPEHVIVELAGRPAMRTEAAGAMGAGRPGIAATSRIAQARVSLAAAQQAVVSRAERAGVRILGQRSMTL